MQFSQTVTLLTKLLLVIYGFRQLTQLFLLN